MPLVLSKRPSNILLVFAVLTAVTLGISVIAYNSVEKTESRLVAAEKSLGKTQQELVVSDEFSTSSLDELNWIQEEFIFKAARQMPPSNDYTVVRRELMRQLTRWLENARVTKTMPIQKSLANYRMGQLHSLEGNYLWSIQALQHCSALALEMNDKPLAARAKNSLACALFQIGNSDQALVRARESTSLFRDVPKEAVAKSIALRNFGLLQEVKGQDGTDSLRSAIDTLQIEEVNVGLSVAKEVLVDTKVSLGQVLFIHEDLAAAKTICESVRDQLKSMLPVADNHNVGSDMAPASRRYENAIALLESNLAAIESKNLAAWRWNPLVDLATELVSLQPDLGARAVAEFDPQTGVVLAWGAYSWAHAPVLEIARATHDRWRIELIADSDDSLQDAIASFQDAGISANNIRFGLQAYEVPWFRDMGPIVTQTPDGTAVWVDSNQVRHDVFQRPVNDALPRLLSTRWKARIVNTSLCIAGGTLLSNGRGLTICSKSVIEENLDYGFDIAGIKKQLHYLSGTTNVLPVPPLIGELTGHIDLFLTFTDPQTLVIGDMLDTQDDNRLMLDQLAEQFSNIESEGRPLRVVRVPLLPIENGYARSYTNVVYANGVLLVPSYQGVAAEIEDKVRSIYQDLLPDWEIKFIDCTWLASKGGSLHCLTSNLGPTPYAPLAKPGSKVDARQTGGDS